jgi:FkbM family methyltransferase
VVDCGLGWDADFSQAVIRMFGSKCYGFDPTRKHQEHLGRVAAGQNGLFRFYPLAIAEKAGPAVFYESLENVSGSLWASHVNIRRDRVNSYPVQCITLADLPRWTGGAPIDLLKLDVEGAEYGIIEASDRRVFDGIGQIVIEFHHESVQGRTQDDTRRAAAGLEACGFLPYTRDGSNYLFFRP